MRALLLSLALLAGCKGDRDKCESACRNMATLLYWRSADKQVAAAPEAGREALRRKLLGKFDSELENGIDMCVNQCSSANNTEQVKCLTEAKTAEQIDVCVKE